MLLLLFVVVVVVVAPARRFGGRRPLLIYGSYAMGVAMVMLTVAVQLKSLGFALFSMMTFILAFSSSWAGGFWVVVSEVFSMRTKAVAAPIATAVLFAGGTVANITFLTLYNSMGSASFLVYAVISLAGAMYLQVYLPETKGRTLAEVQAVMQDPQNNTHGHFGYVCGCFPCCPAFVPKGSRGGGGTGGTARGTTTASRGGKNGDAVAKATSYLKEEEEIGEGEVRDDDDDDDDDEESGGCGRGGGGGAVIIAQLEAVKAVEGGGYQHDSDSDSDNVYEDPAMAATVAGDKQRNKKKQQQQQQQQRGTQLTKKQKREKHSAGPVGVGHGADFDEPSDVGVVSVRPVENKAAAAAAAGTARQPPAVRRSLKPTTPPVGMHDVSLGDDDDDDDEGDDVA